MSRSVTATIPQFFTKGRKIIGVGRNYQDHAAELGNVVPTEPIIFLKPTSSYILEGDKIKLPPKTKEIHHEVELGVVIGKEGRNITPESAMDYVKGYALSLDMTARDMQRQLAKKGHPWSLAKGFDTATPISGFIPKTTLPDPMNVHLWLKVNDEMRQDGNTKDMIFDIPSLISYISQYFTLEEEDVILTGTPAGVGPVKSGDSINCGLNDIVTMKFDVE
ncbi:oxaloacetate decarboxylase, mitochondrial-like [Tubulanus polymorphus]|uniref:oxaloacetate decarboxylase, mitochondrial-like n=1 Tax=Tubulanus polymorphus TaxID=672921 RepID=UPI003DA29F80